MMLKIFFTFSLLIFLLSADPNVLDFCVGDLSLPNGPSGYPCKNPSKVTVEDFVFTGLGVSGNTSNIYKFAITPASDQTFPGLNGQSISISRLDIDVDGVVPVHTHRVSELIIVTEGTIIAGFMDANDRVYYKTLNKGDIMIFPQSLLHFQINAGSTPAVAFVSLNSPNPGFQIVPSSIFGNELPSWIAERITFVDRGQARKLKRIFGGTN